MTAEPKNISILRERLRKSNSTLVFEMDKVTNVELEIVVKYMPEQAAAYTVRNSLWKTITITADILHLEIDMYTQNVILCEGVVGSKAKNRHYNCWDFKSRGFEPTYHCDNDGYITGVLHQAPTFTCNLFSSGHKSVAFHSLNSEDDLDEAYKCMKEYAHIIKEKQHIDSKVRVNYTAPTNFDVGQVMCFLKDDIDFTKKDMVNALLQMKPKKEYLYGTVKWMEDSIHTPEMIELVGYKYIHDHHVQRVSYSFKNNTMIVEMACEQGGIGYYKTKTLLLNYYYIMDNDGESRKEYKVNKTNNKLEHIYSHSPNKYDIQIVDDHNIIIKSDKVSVDIRDIETAFGKPLPEYKFEYLV